MQKLVKQGLKRSEIVDFLRTDFAQYPWSIRSLDRRLRYFQLYYNDQEVTVEQVQDAVRTELEGPGKLLGYRLMQKKISRSMICMSAVIRCMMLWRIWICKG